MCNTRALSPVFRQSIKNAKDPYKSSGASRKIVHILENFNIDDTLFLKEMTV